MDDYLRIVLSGLVKEILFRFDNSMILYSEMDNDLYSLDLSEENRIYESEDISLTKIKKNNSIMEISEICHEIINLAEEIKEHLTYIEN